MEGMVARSVRAVGVALLVAVLTGTGIGFASAGLESDEVTVPSFVGMAPPRQGEGGSFNATVQGSFAQGAPSVAPFEVVSYYRFGSEILDAYARPSATDSVIWGGLEFYPFAHTGLDGDGDDVDPPGWYEGGSIDHVRAGTSDYIGSGWTFNGSQEFTYQPAIVLPPQQGTIDYDFTVWQYDGRAPCLLVNPLQHASVDSHAAISWGRCDLLGLARLDDDWMFQAKPGLRISGFDTVRMEASQNGTTVAFYVNSTLSVPVRAVVQTADGGASIDLVTLLPSDAAIQGPPLVGAPPAIEKAPRQPWGMDDTGSRLIFPPSAAYRKAMEEPTFPGLRDYMAAHPDAYAFLVICNEQESNNGEGTSRYCAFELADGTSSYKFGVQQSVHQPPALGLPEVAVTYSFNEGKDDNDTYWPPQDIPDDLPTLRSLEDRSIAFTGDEDVNNLLAALGPSDRVFFVQVSHQELQFHAAPLPDPSNPTLRYVDFQVGDNSVTMDLDGRATFLAAYGFRANSDIRLVPAAPPPPIPPGESTDGFMPASLLSFWAAPSSPEVAGVGLLSVLVGILYWLWPTIKGGSFLGLFSRVEGSALLDHPGRASLVQAVHAQPGIHFQDLVRRTGLPNGTAVHHLGKLTKAGLLSARPLGRYTCYFPGSQPERAALAAAPALKSEGARLVLRAIQAHPRITGRQVAGQTGLSPSSVSEHVARLSAAGLVSVTRMGRETLVEATPAGHAAA